MVLEAINKTHSDNDRFLPYWAERWPSNGPLLTYLSKRSIPRHALILELGCGLGIISAALSLQTGASVVASDIAREGCRFAAYNIFANGGVPQVVCADWRHPPFKQRFDLIIASDVLYEERWIDPILDCIGELLTQNGSAWIADPCRRFWNRFKQRTAQRGFLQRLLYRSSDDEGTTTVEILELTKQPPPASSCV